MKYGELKRLLKKNGCRLVEEGKNHELWLAPKTESIFPVGRHNSQEVKNGTLHAILKQAGLE